MGYSWTADKWLLALILLAVLGALMALTVSVVALRLETDGALFVDNGEHTTPEPTGGLAPEPAPELTVPPTEESRSPSRRDGTLHVHAFNCSADEGEERTEFFRELDVRDQLNEMVAECSPAVADFTLHLEGDPDNNVHEVSSSAEGRIQVDLPDGVYLLTETRPDLPGNSGARLRMTSDQLTSVVVVNHVAEAASTGAQESTSPSAFTLIDEGEGRYADDFSDPGTSRVGTESSDPSLYRFDIAEGEYVVQTLDSGEASVTTRRLPGIYRDVVVGADARLLGATGGRYVHVSCRMVPESTLRTQYELSVFPGYMFFRLSRWENGNETVLAEGERQDVIAPYNESNRLQLSCVGTELIVWVNGVEVARVEDEVLVEGQVAFGTESYGDQGSVEGRFDNLEVTDVTKAG